ncbi:DUF2382 domain-containing protein [Mycetocola zhadangensis]|uniref:DUF2382 domain-containing protein n=1 Tax=Mycetocola zhadangensis TaxID=1164595 RepID=A0A3L7IX02_9MICO|nr:PRC and DUF2382 domain-containing protein [Mycetocola zhadangensis]RLQ82774.1 DUF2382 domain-containing protein [Mycetocola zhadangensis]GGE98235.1 hypothetical protein GCM10011313_21580 [Mycetocola zhadangensis]
MIDSNATGSLIGATVFDPNGDKIGKIGQIYVDPQDGHPEWASVSTGLFGTSESFVPLEDATFDGEQVRVSYDKSFVKDAPRIEPEGAFSSEEEQRIYGYYSREYTTPATETYETDAHTTDATVGHDTSGPNTDSAMTRSEEQLHVGTEQVQTGRARLRKYVVTEQQNVTVPVTHEEVRLEREPITDANVGDALSGPDISEEEHEVVLTEERVVVEKETVPVERVKLDKETVTEQQTVTENVRKEEVELDTDGTDTHTR